MKDEKKLIEYLKYGKKTDISDALGITPGAVCQMVNNGRDIRILLEEGKVVGAYEVRKVPAAKNARPYISRKKIKKSKR